MEPKSSMHQFVLPTMTSTSQGLLPVYEHLTYISARLSTVIQYVCTYLFTTLPHPHGHWQLQELLGNRQEKRQTCIITLATMLSTEFPSTVSSTCSEVPVAALDLFRGRFAPKDSDIIACNQRVIFSQSFGTSPQRCCYVLMYLFTTVTLHMDIGNCKNNLRVVGVHWCTAFIVHEHVLVPNTV